MTKKNAEKQSKSPKVAKALDEKMALTWTIWNTVEAVLLLAAGIIAIVFGIQAKDFDNQDADTVKNIIVFVLGAFVILDGVLRLVMLALHYKKSDESTILIGGFEITIGIVLMLVGGVSVIDMIIKFLGVALTVIGTLFLGFSIMVIVKKTEKLFMPILEILFGAILIGLGVAILILHYAGDNTTQLRVVFVLIGLIMAVAGIAQAVVVLVTKIRNKKKKSKEKKETINAVPSSKEDAEAIENKATAIEHKQKDEAESSDSNVIEAEVIDEKPAEEDQPDEDDKE